MPISKLLVCPDTHCEPLFDRNRCAWLGNLIISERPDVVVCLGDWFDMSSLSSYDKGKKSFEGRRYKEDIKAGIDGFEKLWGPTNKWNQQQAKNKKAQYNPRKVFLHGNHEHRLNRTIEVQPELEGTIGFDDYRIKDFWDEEYMFKEVVEIEGICFCHYFPSGVLGKPISGDNVAANLINKLHSSCVAGHLHTFDYSVRTNAAGQKMMGLVAGCYVHPESHGDWNFSTYKMWHNSVTMLYDCHDGYAEGLEVITQDRVRNLYG